MNGNASVLLDDLETALDFVGNGLEDREAFVDRNTGAVLLVGSDLDDAPENLEDARYVAVPPRSDLDLGRALVLRFASERWPEQIAHLQAVFSRSGAYRRFKDLLDAHGRLDEWYAFERDATRAALLEWCAAQGISVQS